MATAARGVEVFPWHVLAASGLAGFALMWLFLGEAVLFLLLLMLAGILFAVGVRTSVRAETVLVRCRACRGLSPEEAVYCNACGTPL